MRTIVVTLSLALLATHAFAHEWVRPENDQSKPLWGHVNGIRVGLPPLRGPRGLLRVYTPYLNQPDDRLINFIAIEPIPTGHRERGLSELEWSQLDHARGKRLWSVDDPKDAKPRSDGGLSRGELSVVAGVQTLRVWIAVERFDNGAHVYLRLTFRSDRPREVAIASFVHDDSKPLDQCILTATMGNYARLRNLKLADQSVSSLALWPTYNGDGFSAHAKFPLKKLERTGEGHAIASATPDEKDPANAEYAFGTRFHWRYVGDLARQFWRCENPDPRLQVWVNGRFTYWRSQSPIPGGIAFENFEMVAPFRQGQEFIFGVEPIGK